MLSRVAQAADTACEYDSLADIRAEYRRCEHKIYGWSVGKFYEVYPGGRAIEYTDFRDDFRTHEEEPE